MAIVSMIGAPTDIGASAIPLSRPLRHVVALSRAKAVVARTFAAIRTTTTAAARPTPFATWLHSSMAPTNTNKSTVSRSPRVPKLC